MINSLSLRYLDKYPGNAARDIENLERTELLALLAAIPLDTAAKILINFIPVHGIEVLSELEPSLSISILESMETSVATTMLRRLPTSVQKSLLELAATEQRLETVRLLVQFPPHTVGSIMKPQVLVLRKLMTIEEVKHVLQHHVKELPHEFYIVDQQYKLSGYVTAGDLLLKENITDLGELSKPCPYTVPARQRIESAVDNLGWLNRNQLPVIDNDGVLQGSLDKHELRRAMAELEQQRVRSGPSRDILIGLADTFLVSISELMSSEKLDEFK